MLRAFETGNPAVVYREAQRLVAAYREVTSDAARLRFRLNFGTDVCERCDGLHAGPGVVATCYQARECHYGNLREAGESVDRRSRVIERLSRGD